MAELADALDSGSSVRKDVEVQVLSSAQEKTPGVASGGFFVHLGVANDWSSREPFLIHRVGIATEL